MYGVTVVDVGEPVPLQARGGGNKLVAEAVGIGGGVRGVGVWPGTSVAT